MKTKYLVLVILLALLGGFAGSYFGPQKMTVAASKTETAYERVIRTKTLRCGYFIEAPFTIYDDKAQTRSGISYDLTNKIAAELGLKVDWVEEISFATFPDDLASGRYDAVCADVFILPRAGKVDYTRPYAFVPVYGYVRKGDSRFDNSFANIDWTKIKISGLDGEGATTAARKLLHQAQFEILSQNLQISEMLTAVSNNKADIAFVMPSVFESFNASNPDALQKANLDKPLYIYGTGFALPVGEFALKNMLDNTLLQLTASGELAAIIDKYDPKDLFMRPSYK